MKLTKIAVSVLLLAPLIGPLACGPHRSPVEAETDFLSEAENHGTKAMPTVTKKELGRILHRLSPAWVSRGKVIHKLREIVPMLSNNSIAALRTSENPGQKPVETLDLAEFDDLINGIHKYWPRDTIKILIEVVSSYKAYSEDQSDVEINSALISLFEILLSGENHLAGNIKFDALLVGFVAFRVARHDKISASEFSQSDAGLLIKKYFSLRLSDHGAAFANRLHNDKFSVGAEIAELFNIYGTLYDLTSDPSYVASSPTIDALLEAVELESLSANGMKYLTRLQIVKMTQRTPASKTFIGSVLKTGHLLVSRLQESRYASLEALRWLDVFNSFVEWQVQQLSSFKTAVNVLDKRDFLNSRLSQVVQSKDSDFLQRSGDVKLSHPLLAAAIRQAQLISTKATQLNSVDLPLLPYIASMLTSVRQQVQGIEVIDVDPTKLGQNDIAKFYERFKAMTVRDRIVLYQSGLLAVHFGRHFLLEIRGSGQDTHRAQYKTLRSILEATLCARFADSKTGIGCVYVGNGEVRSVGLTKKLPELAAEVNSTGGKMVFRTSTQFVGPGIYLADADVEMQFGDLDFHPLAMIYSQGFNITFKGSSLLGAWVDTSGRDQTHDNLIAIADGVPAKPDGTEGRPPSKPVKADSGSNAGNIEMQANSVNGLLVALGGDGENGFQGANSPLCNPTYQPVIHHYQVVVGTRDKVCTRWRISHIGDMTESQFLCGKEDVLETRSRVLEVNAGPGGDGGNGGAAGKISFSRPNSTAQISQKSSESSPLIKNFTYAIGGRGGMPGNGGQCGPNPTHGLAGVNGQTFNYVVGEQ